MQTLSGIVSRTNAPTNKDINTLARENIDVLSSEYVDLSKYPKYVDQYNFSAKVRDEGEITEKEVRALFDLWNSALATESPDAVAKRYASKAVLLPTVSDVPRTDYALIKDYFVGFLKKKPQGKIESGDITIGHNWCQDAGIYEFTMGASGDKVKGCYSFVYVYEDGEWKISHHHSSVMPEPILGPAPKPAVAETKKELVEA